MGLGSGLCWGTADFFGGLQSRSRPALAVAIWSQAVGALALALVLALFGGPFSAGGSVWGLAAGIFGGLGVLFFYSALARGTMSVVAPIASCGAVVPLVVAALAGEMPSLLASAGIVAAMVGVVLVSLPGQHQPTSANPGFSPVVLALSLGAAAAFGVFFLLLDRGAAAAGGSTLWVIGGARISSLSLLVLMALVSRRPAPWPGRTIVPIGLIGIMDTAANALFAFATIEGNLAIVSVLGSLYPVTTILLARIILAERLARPQAAGVTLALAGVAGMAAG